MTRIRLAGLALATSLIVLLGAPGALLAASFALTTPYPSVTVQPGTTVTFDLSVTTPSPERVGLAVSGVPTGWTATLNGGGNAVNAVYTGGSTPPALQLSVNVPQSAAPGTQGLTVTATAAQGTVSLPLQVLVKDAAGGGIALTSDFPKLSGTTSSTFTFSLTLANNGTQRQTFTLQAQGPAGWTVSASPASNGQAVTVAVDGGSNTSINVSASPPSGATAGAYPILVTAAAGSQSAKAQLEVDLTGSPALKLSTPNQILNTQVTSGSSGTFALIVTNSGSAPLSTVTLTSTPPQGWKVTFAPSSIASMQPGASSNVTATITPASDALAGDYDLTMTAASGSTTDSLDIRTTVQTSALWGFVGIALIAIVLIGLGWVFRRYGRR